MTRLEDYRHIIGDERVYKIYKNARKLYGKKIININSTYYGGGVAEIMNSLVLLMNDVGLDAGWWILRGNPHFFNITKKFHNMLQGEENDLSEEEKLIYMRTNEDFARYTHIENMDCVIIHDPQPLPLIYHYKKRQPWIWRCHVDLSHPNPTLWEFLKKYILKYEVVVVSNEDYKKLPVEYRIILPAINPISEKNRELTDEQISKILFNYDIPTDKPIVTQISRFDKWKDPEGVVDSFLKVKEKVDCRLVLCGSMASDDPEGIIIYENIKDKVKDLMEKKDVILLTVMDDMLVNALQRVSSVVVQKSHREGFGLTVTEALWKGTPVVASSVGGITLQVKNEENGFLLEPKDNEGFAEKIIEILKNPKIKDRLGENAKKTVKDNFLITRLLNDYIDLLNSMLS